MSHAATGAVSPSRRRPKITSKYTSEKVTADPIADLPPAEAIELQDRAARKARRENTAHTRDERFKMKVFWSTLALLTILDYLYLPVYLPDLRLPWWGHTALVVPTTFICVILIIKLRLLRSMRRVMTGIAIFLFLLGVLAVLDLIPHAH